MINTPSPSPEELAEQLTIDTPMSAAEATEQLKKIGLAENTIGAQLPKMLASEQQVLLRIPRSGTEPTVSVESADSAWPKPFDFNYSVNLETLAVVDDTDRMNSVRQEA